MTPEKGMTVREFVKWVVVPLLVIVFGGIGLQVLLLALLGW